VNFDDRMLERDLEEALGGDAPSPELRNRLLDTASRKPAARVIPMRPRRITAPVPKRSNAPAWIAAAAAVLIAAGIIGLAMQQPKPEREQAVSASNQPAPAPKPQAERTAPTPEANQAVPLPTSNEPQLPPAPRPDPRPEHVPPVAPKLPPVPVPEPAPKPDDVVEQPKPEPKPEGTEAKPEPVPPSRKLGATLIGTGKLKSRQTDAEAWVDFTGSEIMLGTQLKALKPVELRMSDGGLLRFDGELALMEESGALQVALLARRTELYLDNAGCKSALGVRVGTLSCTALGVIHAEHDGAALVLACYEGRVECGAQQLAAGQQAKLGEKGFGKSSDVKTPRPRLVQDASARVLIRGDFNEQGGVARVSGPNADVAAPLGELACLAGATLKIRYRVKGGKALYVQLQKTAGDVQYGKWVPLAKVGDWQELEVSLADFSRDDGKGEGAPAPGELVRTLRVFVQDGEAPELEIDWYEISRRAN